MPCLPAARLPRVAGRLFIDQARSGAGGRARGSDGRSPWGWVKSLRLGERQDRQSPHAEVFFLADKLLDLLGDPVDPGHGLQGRPQHVATDENRCKVILLLAFDKTLNDVAAALGITQKTLRKHYSRELKIREGAKHRLEGELLAALAKAAAAGKVAAVDKLFKRIDQHELNRVANRPGKPAAPAAKEEKLGKKETALRDARHAHKETGWGELLN